MKDSYKKLRGGEYWDKAVKKVREKLDDAAVPSGNPYQTLNKLDCSAANSAMDILQRCTAAAKLQRNQQLLQ